MEQIKKLNKWDLLLVAKELKQMDENLDNFLNVSYVKQFNKVKYFINLKDGDPKKKFNWCIDARDWKDEIINIKLIEGIKKMKELNISRNITLRIDEKDNYILVKWINNNDIDKEYIKQFLISNKLHYYKTIENDNFEYHYFKKDLNKHNDFIKEQAIKFISII